MIRRSAILLTLLVAACAPEGPPPTLPGASDAMVGRDPVVAVGQAVIGFFNDPIKSCHHRPQDARQGHPTLDLATFFAGFQRRRQVFTNDVFDFIKDIKGSAAGHEGSREINGLNFRE